MSIGRDEVLHVAKLAELAVRENELRRLVEQMNRIVDYVASSMKCPAIRTGRAVPGRAASAHAPRGRGGASAAGAPAGRDGARVRGWVLPGAPPWRDGGSVTAETAGQRGRRGSNGA